MMVTQAMQSIVLLGTGGFARETAAVIESINAVEPKWHLVGFLDDNENVQGSLVAGYPVLGPLEWSRQHEDVMVVACMGNPHNYGSRKAVVDRLNLPLERYATLLHPTACVGGDSRIGAGTVVLAGTVLTVDVQVGNHVSVMPHVLLTHDNHIADFVTLTGGVRLAGVVSVQEGAYLGSGALIDSGVTIGAWSQIGAGSLVRRSVPAGEVWWGSPASFQRKAVSIGVPQMVSTDTDESSQVKKEALHG